MKNLTDYFLSKLFPDMKQIMYTPKTKYLTNNIRFKNVLIYGKPGSGKTELVRAIDERAVLKYGKENVNASVSYNGDLDLLIEYGLDDKPVQILFADNVTLVKPKKEALQNFFKIRHYYRMLTGRSNGLILSFLAAHRFHGVNISLRTDLDFLIVRNSPTNPWDNNIIKRFIGNLGIHIMEIIEEERETRRDLYKFSMFYSKTKTGLLELPLAKENYLKVLDVYSIPSTVIPVKVGRDNVKVSPASVGLRL